MYAALSYALRGWRCLRAITHGLRHGLHSSAASRLRQESSLACAPNAAWPASGRHWFSAQHGRQNGDASHKPSRNDRQRFKSGTRRWTKLSNARKRRHTQQLRRSDRMQPTAQAVGRGRI